MPTFRAFGQLDWALRLFPAALRTIKDCVMLLITCFSNGY
jgi:hypothetical protein